MNEKIYFWGLVHSSLNTPKALLLPLPPDCVNVNINRHSSWAWTEKKVFSWTQDYSSTPTPSMSADYNILNVTGEIGSPVLETTEQVTLAPDSVLDTVSNFSGFIILNKASQVKSSLNSSAVLSGIKKISSECSSFYALSKEGEVYKWAHIHTPSILEIPEKIVQISCGSQHTVFKSFNLGVYVLGSNSYGQIGLPSVSEVQVPIRLNGVCGSKVVCGGFHTLLLDDTGKLLSSGLGTMGQLINGGFNNNEVFTECELDAGLGRVADIYCAELTSFVKFTQNDCKKVENTERYGPILGFLHKHLVAATERAFLQRVKEEVKARNNEEKKRLKRELRVQEALVLFENEILPNWDQYKGSKVLGELVKKGLPSKFRGKVWVLLHEKKMKIREKDFEEGLKMVKELSDKNDLNSEEQGVVHNSLKLISLDITRTFNTLGYFSKDSPMNKDLQVLLEAACLFRQDIGYIQGMSYVAGMLLLNLEMRMAFSIFISIISSPVLLPFYKIDQEGIQRRNEIFLAVLLENLPDVHRDLEVQGVQLPIFLMEWFVTLYSKTLPQEVSVRVWDLYFYYGESALFKAGITIMKILKDELLSKDLSDIMTCFTHISEKITDPEKFILQYDTIKLPENLKRLINNL